MEEDGATLPEAPPEDLAEAPKRGKDLRDPLDPRNPATKRTREPESPKGVSKYQIHEVPDNKRSLEGAEARGAKWQTVEDTGASGSKGADSFEEVNKDEVGSKTSRKEGRPRDLVWRDIGSGTMSRVFKNAKFLQVSTRGGPQENEVHRRTVWDVQTGKVLDDCIIEDTPDEELYKAFEFEADIRVELVMKNALDLFKKEGSDVVEVFSPPRIAQEASVKAYGGTRLKPGWSLDLTRNDPKTGQPWDLSDPKVQSRVKRLVIEGKPLFLIGPPTLHTILNYAKRQRREKERRGCGKGVRGR